MRVFRQIDDLPAFNKAVLTIGTFDGVHKGHQELLARIKRLAKRNNGESIVLTFHPHPRQVIYPNDNSLRLINTLEEKIALFEKYEIDNLVIVPFTVGFSQISADEYIEKFLLGKFNPQCIVIGYDHRFGLNRQGDINYLKWYSKTHDFDVVEIAAAEIDDMAVSSTKIRNALQLGRITEANNLLGHPFTMSGKVVKGQQLGTKIGYPTANIKIENPHKLKPADGVYAVTVKHGKEYYEGMLYIGNRPTISGDLAKSIEINIFDFSTDIYGEELQVTFHKSTRGDKTFDDLEGLKEQLAKDEIAVKAALQHKTVSFSNKNTPTTAVVILNYNGADYLKQHLPSVIQSAKNSHVQVIVADNGSTDHSLEVLKSTFPAVEVIALSENHGFAGGYNEALKNLHADYYVLLNSDVEVTPNWLEPCIAFLEQHPNVGACQPKIRAFHQKDTFEYAGAAGGWLDYLGYPFCRGRIFATVEKDEGQYDQAKPIFWATGAALFIRAELFHQLGGFDKDYFAHAEEIDLCWRVKRAGYRIFCVPKSVVYHVGGGTLNYQSPRKTFLNFRNTLITSFKNEPGRKLIWWLPLRLLLDGLAGALFISQGKWSHVGAIVKAHWNFFPKIAYWWKKRKAYDKIIAKSSIGQPTMSEGLFKGSVVLEYYGLKHEYFRDIVLLKAQSNTIEKE